MCTVAILCLDKPSICKLSVESTGIVVVPPLAISIFPCLNIEATGHGGQGWGLLSQFTYFVNSLLLFRNQRTMINDLSHFPPVIHLYIVPGALKSFSSRMEIIYVIRIKEIRCTALGQYYPVRKSLLVYVTYLMTRWIRSTTTGDERLWWGVIVILLRELIRQVPQYLVRFRQPSYIKLSDQHNYLENYNWGIIFSMCYCPGAFWI